jgi:DNA-binding XRE family transcriptional regulator
VPLITLVRAREVVASHRRDHEWLTLKELARELGVNIHTLRAAARTGRLKVQFSVRSVFGRPGRRATRAAGREYLQTGYCQPVNRVAIDAPLVSVPNDYAERLRHIRQRLRLTQGALATAIGAAGKAVIYQWESGKRTPSPVFWAEIERLQTNAQHFFSAPPVGRSRGISIARAHLSR